MGWGPFIAYRAEIPHTTAARGGPYVLVPKIEIEYDMQAVRDTLVFMRWSRSYSATNIELRNNVVTATM